MKARGGAAAIVEAVDWQQPWLAPFERPVFDDQASVAETLNRRRSGNMRFVASSEMPSTEAYERFIFETRSIPTRDNLHDFFNGFAWLHFPQAKRRLNELQAAEISRSGIGAIRGALRDALTLFDENGAVLDAPPLLWEALRARDWHRLFVTERALWREARLLVFGHALLEKLVAPRKPLTAHVLCAPCASPSITIDDAAIAAALDAAHLANKPFVPLPVLGVPGWWAPNEMPAFYDDSEVFRPPRPARR